MITEDYVSFETAELLKEKGFYEFCPYSYSTFFPNSPHFGVTDLRKGSMKHQIYAPTLQMAMKWLRREYGLHCSVDYDYVLGWYCQITSLKETVEYDYEEMKHYQSGKAPERFIKEAWMNRH